MALFGKACSVRHAADGRNGQPRLRARLNMTSHVEPIIKTLTAYLSYPLTARDSQARVLLLLWPCTGYIQDYRTCSRPERRRVDRSLSPTGVC